MSEGTNKRPKRCKLESRTSKKPIPCKRRRRVPTKKVSKENKETSEPDVIVSHCPEPPMQYSIQVKVESGDENWWYEEETPKLRNKNPSSEQSSHNIVVKETETVKSNKLKFAYLEALHKNKVLEKLEVSSNQLKKQSVTEVEHLNVWKNKICEDTFEDICIKNEIPDEDQYTRQNLTEHPRSLSNPSPNNDESSCDSAKKQTEAAKSNKLKFAYLEALQQNKVLEKLDESCSQLKRKRVSELENFKGYEDLSIKQNVLEDDQVTSENLMEHLGITIKDEPLLESVDKPQGLTDANQTQLCLLVSVESTKHEEEMINNNDNEEESGGSQVESPNPLREYNIDEYRTNYVSSQFQSTSDPDYTSEVPSWHINSRYFDLALINAVESDVTKQGLKFECGLCGLILQTFKQGSNATEACVQDIRTHLNYDHLNDTLALRVVHPTAPCTILAEKVSVSDERYVEILAAARMELQLTKTFLLSIVDCYTSVKKHRERHSYQILSYKCYVCKLCYGYVGHYVEHLRATHAECDIKLSTEMVKTSFINVIAFQTIPIYKDFHVITDESNRQVFRCLLCKVDFGRKHRAYLEHREVKLRCSGCGRRYFCHMYHEHIGQCSSYFQKTYPKTCPCKQVFYTAATLDMHQKTCRFNDSTLAFNCLVCNYTATTISMLQGHQYYTHTVRSDEFVFSSSFWRSIKEYRYPLGLNANTQPAATKSQRKIRKVVPKSSDANKQPAATKSQRKIRKDVPKASESTPFRGFGRICPICPFRPSFQLKSKTLEEHMVASHLVRSDCEIAPPVSCNWCSFSFASIDAVRDESLLRKHTTRSHLVNYRVVQNSSCNIGDVCLICSEICREGSLDAHLRKNHTVRSDEGVCNLDVTRCNLCLTTFPGDPHQGPEILESVCCSHCRWEYHKNRFVTCHLKGYQLEICTNCSIILKESCMRARREASERGDHMVVHECFKCGYKDDELSAIEAHCKDCFTTADGNPRVFFTKQLIVPKIGVSTDPRNDHSYAKKSILAEANELTETELPAQNLGNSAMSVSNICTEVYENTDFESTTSDDWHKCSIKSYSTTEVVSNDTKSIDGEDCPNNWGRMIPLKMMKNL